MKKLMFFVSFLLVLMFIGCANTHKYGPYYGQVVDAETKEPIEGAVVLVVFLAEEPSVGGLISHDVDAFETVTDKNGEFSIPAMKVRSPKSLWTLNKSGYFTIFKPGFGHYPESKGVGPMFVPNGSLPPQQKVVVQLPRLSTNEEIMSNMTPRVRSQIPNEKQQKLYESINEWNRMMGISYK